MNLWQLMKKFNRKLPDRNRLILACCVFVFLLFSITNAFAIDAQIYSPNSFPKKWPSAGSINSISTCAYSGFDKKANPRAYIKNNNFQCELINSDGDLWGVLKEFWSCTGYLPKVDPGAKISTQFVFECNAYRLKPIQDKATRDFDIIGPPKIIDARRLGSDKVEVKIKSEADSVKLVTDEGKEFDCRKDQLYFLCTGDFPKRYYLAFEVADNFGQTDSFSKTFEETPRKLQISKSQVKKEIRWVITMWGMSLL